MTWASAEVPVPIDVEGPPADAARMTGLRLAEHPLLAARQGDDRPAIEDVLADARPLLSTYGIALELLRTRPGCVVLRTRGNGGVAPQVSCELVKGLIGALAEDVCEVKATLVENTCAQRGAPACLYSLMWEHRSEPSRVVPAAPPPETLLDPPPDPDPYRWAASPVPPLPAAADVATLPAWDPPSPTPPDPVPTSDPRTAAASDPRGQSTATGPLGGSSVPTAASSVGYQIQMSTPQVVVTPAPAPAPAPIANPVQNPGAAAPGARVRRTLPRGMARRSWLLALALLAGAAGGWFAGRHAGTSYGAQASLLVQSGAGKTGPGSANDALALATTYSAVIPRDQAFLSTVAAALGTTPSDVSSSLGVTVENNTSILVITYTASSPAPALRGARAVAQVLASDTPATPAIAAGSIAVVSLPTSAQRQGTLHKYGIEIGALLGLIVGLILVLAAERADPRVDDAPTMAAAAGCRAAQVPGDISHAELARVLSDTSRSEASLTVVPLAVGDTAPTMELARELRPCWPLDGPAVAISPAFASGVVELSRGTGPTVLVTHTGAHQRDVAAAAERLRMIGRAPVWGVLAVRRLRQRRWGRVG